MDTMISAHGKVRELVHEENLDEAIRRLEREKDSLDPNTDQSRIEEIFSQIKKLEEDAHMGAR